MSGVFNANWERAVKGVEENLDAMSRFDQNIGLYYLTYYVCPGCGRSLLYKIKARGTVTYFQGDRVPIFNIFTCPACRRMLASPVNSMGQGKLSELALVSRPYPDTDDYISILNDGIKCMEFD